MATTFTDNLFATKYKDDFSDSAGFHRILFNPRRALQARELTQLQTIIQDEVKRFGSNIFKEGAAVNPGGIVINNNYEFIKITDASFPADIIDTEFTGQTSNVKVRILEAVSSDGSDPNTLYVRYTNSLSGTSGSTPIRVTPGEQLNADIGSGNMTVQTTNTASNPAIGSGIRVSVGKSDFFVQGFFVHVKPQSIIIEKYSKLKSVNLGFKIVQDIVTVNDDTSLYDNQGAVLNQTAPGADRFRIQLQLTTEDQIDASDNFVVIGRIENSKLVEVATGHNQYNRINDILAQRTKEESGNYVIKPFTVAYDSADASNLQLTVSEGTAYVNGYRVNNPSPTKITVPRSTATTTFNNQPTGVDYGNFVIATAIKGAPRIDSLALVRISTNAANVVGSAIGQAKIRSIEKLTDGTFKVYLFDIEMAKGQSFNSARAIGNSQSDFVTLKTKTDTNNNVVAELFEINKEDLIFELPNVRPSTLSDVNFAVQRRFTGTTDSAGNLGINLTVPGETFVNTSDWLLFRDDSGPELTASSISGNATQASTIGTGVVGKSVSVLAYVNKSSATAKTKTLATHTVTQSPVNDSDGEGNVVTVVFLGATDIFDVLTINKDSAGGENVTSYFELDNGQRDAYYQGGRLILRGEFSNPGQVRAQVRHFTQTTSGDFYSVNSYNSIPYAQIPTFTSKTGKEINLRDVLDFRPTRGTGSTFQGSNARIIELPKNTDTITSDNSHFMPRNDKITITETGDLNLVLGSSSLTPKFADTPANSLELYRTRMGANTLSGDDVTYDMIEAKSFTMKDIGKLERRIEKLEELQSLSLLELDTSTTDVLDSAGNDRVKVGFVVDNFVDQSLSLLSSVQYKASIDPKSHTLHPAYYENNAGLLYDSADAGSSGVVKKGDNVYLNFRDSAHISQLQSSKTIDVNSFDIFQFNGNVRLSPSSDEFRDTERVGTKAISGTNKLSNNEDTLRQSIKWNWIGNDANGNVSETTEIQNDTRSFSGQSSSFLTGGLEEVDKTIVNRVVASETIRKIIDDRVVDIAIIPFMRSRLVNFEAIGMRPNTRVFPYFDGVDVSSWVRESTFAFHGSGITEYGNTASAASQHPLGSSNLTTDAEGKVSGTFFIPNTDAISFRCGVREFKLLDITTSDETNASTKATALYNCSGVIEKNRTGVVSTRHITVNGTDKNILSDKVIGTADTRGRVDPLAQAFFVNNDKGMFVSSIELFFQAKDNDLPIWIQIIPIINGTPSREVIVPGSIKYLSPTGVNVSDNASASTTFQFDEPVFLDSFTEYVIAINSDSKKYKIWAGETGEIQTGSTEKRITRKTVVGALYMPQNSYKWEPVYDMDLKFKINRAVFTTGNHTAILNNHPIPFVKLIDNPIRTGISSTTIRVVAPNHGFQIGDTVTFQGVSGTIGGVTVDGDKTITAVDGTGFTFTGTQANATSSGGGNNVVISQHYKYDNIIPYLETLVPQGTSISTQMKQTSSKSLAGSETAYVKETTFSDITLKENNFLSAPNVVTNDAKAAKSATMKVTMSSSNDFVSPVIDLQRASLMLIGNKIDNQASVAAAGFNVPLNILPETDKTRGTHLSKHVTKPVSLLSNAVGLRILLSANRPSSADFDLYFKTVIEDQQLDDTQWTLAPRDANVPSDENRDVFREYTYLIGGQNGTLTAFSAFQLKIVFRSSNSSKVPVIKDLRAIALGV